MYRGRTKSVNDILIFFVPAKLRSTIPRHMISRSPEVGKSGSILITPLLFIEASSFTRLLESEPSLRLTKKIIAGVVDDGRSYARKLKILV